KSTICGIMSMRIVPSLIIDEHFNHNTGNYSLSLSTLQKLYAKTKSQIPEMTYSSGNSLDYSLTFSAGIDNFFQRMCGYLVIVSGLRCFGNMSSMRKETYSMTEREMAKLNVVNLV